MSECCTVDELLMFSQCVVILVCIYDAGELNLYTLYSDSLLALLTPMPSLYSDRLSSFVSSME